MDTVPIRTIHNRGSTLSTTNVIYRPINLKIKFHDKCDFGFPSHHISPLIHTNTIMVKQTRSRREINQLTIR